MDVHISSVELEGEESKNERRENDPVQPFESMSANEYGPTQLLSTAEDLLSDEPRLFFSSPVDHVGFRIAENFLVTVTGLALRHSHIHISDFLLGHLVGVEVGLSSKTNRRVIQVVPSGI